MIFIQVKKDEIKTRILIEAEKEFFQKGFSDASLRKIVKDAGTSLGNFYNYFKGKEDLFRELVHEEYEGFINFINNHEEFENPSDMYMSDDITVWKKILCEIIDKVSYIFTDRFLILIESSKGTEYENSKERLISVIKEHFLSHMSFASVSSEFMDLMARQLIHGITYIIKSYKDMELRLSLLADLILFYFIGAAGLFKEGVSK